MKEQKVRRKMENCIFCKIAKKEIPAKVIYEDEGVIAFLDVNPCVLGHLLVVPKKHSRWLWDMKIEDYQKITERVYYLATVLKKAFKTEWVEQIVAGMGVPHTHIHLMPRQKDDGIEEIPTKPLEPKPTAEKMNEIAEKIKQQL